VKRTEESEDEFAVFAVTLRRGEPWLLRAVMRVGGKRPWSFSRISVEHLTSPDGVEVLADAMRCFSLSEVRSKAIDQVHRKREFLEVRRQAGAEISAADKRWARRVSEEAKRLPLDRGPKGFPV